MNITLSDSIRWHNKGVVYSRYHKDFMGSEPERVTVMVPLYFKGWSNGSSEVHQINGYSFTDYFDESGEYMARNDEHRGIYPVFEDIHGNVVVNEKDFLQQLHTETAKTAKRN